MTSSHELTLVAVAPSFVPVVDVGPQKREEKVRDSGIAEIPSRDDEEERVNIPLAEILEEEVEIRQAAVEEEDQVEIVAEQEEEE